MSDSLLSVGLDVGTTTTQMIVSSLQIENRASGFAVPEMAITGRQILYRSPVEFTPLWGNARIDENGRIVTEGSQVMLGGNDSYIAMCHKCWKDAIAAQAGYEETLF